MLDRTRLIHRELHAWHRRFGRFVPLASLTTALACSLVGCGDSEGSASSSSNGGAGAGAGGPGAGGALATDDDDVVGTPWDGSFPQPPELLVPGMLGWRTLSTGDVVHYAAGSDEVKVTPVTGGESVTIASLPPNSREFVALGEAVLMYATDDDFQETWRFWSRARGLVTPSVDLGYVNRIETFTATDGTGSLILLTDTGADRDAYWLDTASLAVTALGTINFAGQFAQFDCEPAVGAVYCAMGDENFGGVQLWRADATGGSVLQSFPGESGNQLSPASDGLLLQTFGKVRHIALPSGNVRQIPNANDAYARQGGWIVAWSDDGTVRVLEPDLSEAWVIATGATRPEERLSLADPSRLRLAAYCSPGLEVVNLATKKVSQLATTCRDVMGMTYSDRQVLIRGGSGRVDIVDVDTLERTSFQFSPPENDPFVYPLGQSKLFTIWITGGVPGVGYYDGNSPPGTPLGGFPAPLEQVSNANPTPDSRYLLIRGRNEQAPQSADLYRLAVP